MDAEKSMSAAFDTLIKMDRGLPGGRQSNATEPGDDIVAFGATSIGEIEKLMEELRTARDYLQSEGERVRRMNARYAHLTRTASASVKVIAESMGKWRTTEMDAAPEAYATMGRSHASPASSLDEGKLQHELTDTQARN
jgi:hypothetical protein